MKKSLQDSLLGLLFPRVCPVCGEILTEQNQEEKNPYICKYCYKKLQFVENPFCLRCGVPLADETEEYCENCLHTKRFFDQGAALLVHDDNARKILYDLKYAGRKDNADFAALEAAGRLGRKIAFWKPDVIVPVPLHKSRQFERGFNQAVLLAEIFSEALRRQTGFELPVDETCLVRKKKTRPQKELSMSERKLNMEGTFCVRMPENSGYRSVLLLDDIFTSGATLNECARELKKAGVKKVYFLVMSIVG